MIVRESVVLRRQVKTLMMISAQVGKTSVNVTTNSPSQDYTQPDNHTSAYNILLDGLILVDTVLMLCIHCSGKMS